MTFTYSRGQKSLSGITPGYHMSMHAKNHVPRPSRLAVIEKCHVCDGQTDKQTDRQTNRQTDRRKTDTNFFVLDLHRYDPYQHFDPETLS